MTSTCSPTRIVCFVVVCVLSIVGCRPKVPEDDENKPAVKSVVSVKVDKIQIHDAIVAVSAIGKTDALRKEKMYSPIAGKIIALKAYEGRDVRRGDIVAVIQSKESNAAITGAEASLLSAKTPKAKAEAEQLLRLARSTQSSVNVFAKFDGVVSTRSVSEGEFVAENGELMTMIDLSTINFLADVPVRDVSSVKTGQQAMVRFQSFPAKEFPAIVDAINPQTDVQSQTVKARLRFLASSIVETTHLRTDIIGTATIVTGMRHHAFFVPKTAVLRDDENTTYAIVILTDDSLSLAVPVTIIAGTDTSVEVAGKGLREGMHVITEGNYALADSTRVTVARQD